MTGAISALKLSGNVAKAIAKSGSAKKFIDVVQKPITKEALESMKMFIDKPANRLKDIRDLADVLDKLPKLKADKLSIGWLDFCASMSKNEKLKSALEQIKSVVGKNASISYTKEASKYKKGASVFRITIKDGKKPFAKLAATIDNTGAYPAGKIGGSIQSAKTSFYAAGDMNKLNSSILKGHIGEGFDYHPATGLLKAHINAGETLSAGIKSNVKAVAPIVDKASGGKIRPNTEFKVKSAVMKGIERVRQYLGMDRKPAQLKEMKQAMYDKLFDAKIPTVAK